MRRPTEQELKLLNLTERVCFEIADAVNRRPVLKRAANLFQGTVGQTWVHYATRNLVHSQGLERLKALRPERGVFLVCNHRSFFDFYCISSVLLRACSWVRGIYFPVRSNFFYEGPAGVVVNMVMSAWAMYPPVLRAPSKRGFNTFTLDAVDALLQGPGNVIGYHPEGRRGTGPDPYELLPASIGTGSIVYRARPVVIPVFTLGLINNLPKQVVGNFTGDGEPVTMIFGEPLDLERFYAMPAEPETYKAIAEHIRDAIIALSVEERALRKAKGLRTLDPNASASA
jgi:1-acyl-sn-glycerol-3-phosphate acyltransferase